MQFSPRSKDELANALKEMMSQGMEGLILDLRDNAVDYYHQLLM